MNNSVDLFGLALGVNTPWFVGKVDFINKGTKEELHISIDFARGATFKDANGAACKVHDTVEKVWRHLSFFQYDCYITCRVPRIKTSDGKVELITTPWARKNSGFSLLFESCVMALIGREMTIKKVAETLGINDKSIWVIFNYWIKKAKQTQDQSRVSKIGIDETSTKKGHNYVTVGVDLEDWLKGERYGPLESIYGEDSPFLQDQYPEEEPEDIYGGGGFFKGGQVSEDYPVPNAPVVPMERKDKLGNQSYATQASAAPINPFTGKPYTDIYNKG